ncbi:MAG TPA: flagellar biosynthetic protein FliQ [Acidobacteriota bacterium]|nr:flagellar biosynthetic protein FliQ [Acidobacteriota bacterium]HNB71755.1 flagellar biosynthetic protein FliQ [Acidobacteriota bacterium]HNC44597.1 flagellar biosynthetic protein FliQ [Acidobacteriota bacterium]HNG93321.1 flagellar biosynthetic protein FliQ [Acidobacteriota bacterium]HNH83657.1 flagellar biosynthetic protein FliQ [Acidobacteriota bacterium]
MPDALIVSLIRQALETLLWITGPILVVAVVVGTVVSLIQTLTSIQDQTFSFAPRLIAVFVVFLISFPWALRVLITFTQTLFRDFTPYIR